MIYTLVSFKFGIILSAVWSYSKPLWERYPLNKTGDLISWLVKRQNAHNRLALFGFVLNNVLYWDIYLLPLTPLVLIHSDRVMNCSLKWIESFFLILETRNISSPWIICCSVDTTHWVASQHLRKYLREIYLLKKNYYFLIER